MSSRLPLLKLTASLTLACSSGFHTASVLAHGRLVMPPSRIVLCTQNENANCVIEAWRANSMENGKFFPATQADLADSLAVDAEFVPKYAGVVTDPFGENTVVFGPYEPTPTTHKINPNPEIGPYGPTHEP